MTEILTPAEFATLRRKPQKYRNRFTTVDGIKFRSKRESERYKELKLMAEAGAISALQLQVRYSLHVKDVFICTYIADFAYLENGKRQVEDAKGCRTLLYTAKKNLMLALYGIEVREV